MLQTTVRDCLFLNWALPAEGMPEPPAPLRYQLHSWQGRDWVFASALLFHQDALHLTALPRLRFGYPQLNLRLYVFDEDGVPSVLFRRMLMPAWVVPGTRLITHQPASRARLQFPRPSKDADGGPWTWRAERKGSFEVMAWQSSPMLGEGPRLGSWEQTVRYFEERPRGYAVVSGALRRISAEHPPVPVWPVKAEVHGDGMLPRLLELPAGTVIPPLHSAWICPEISFVFELGIVLKVPVPPPVPQPVAGRVVSFRWPSWPADGGPRSGRQGGGRERRQGSC